MKDSKLYGKTVIWNGDSICAGNSVKGNWATRIGDKYSQNYKNYAVGGGTIVEEPFPTKSGSRRHSVSRTLEKMYNEYPDADYVILEGGTNDADLYARHFEELGDRMGEIVPNDYSGEYDVSTFCGSVESVFYRALNYWSGKKIGFIIAQKMGRSKETQSRRRRYFDVCAEAAKKWGIPVLDLWHGCYLNPCLEFMYDPNRTPEENEADNTGFYTDGQHLTSRGYDFTAELVEKFISEL